MKQNDTDYILNEIREVFRGDSSGHDYWHSVRVYQNALKIAQGMECDEDVIALAALLHDVDDAKLFDTKDHETARRIMKGAGVDEDTMERVADIIGKISYKGRDSVVPDSIEGKIVQDADRLDALGAIGIARTFAYGGSRGRDIYDPELEPQAELDEGAYLEGNSPSVNHFYEKLFRLKDMMNTETGRRIAAQRDAFMHQYLEQFMNEWGGIKVEDQKSRKNNKKIKLIKRDGDTLYYSHNWVRKLIRVAANRVLVEMSDDYIKELEYQFGDELEKLHKKIVPYEEWRQCMSTALAQEPEVLQAFLAAHKEESADYFEEICDEMNKIVMDGDRSNGSVDSSLTSSKRALIVDALEKITYKNYHLSEEQKKAFEEGFIYIHDMGHRRDSINCCLFDMAAVLEGGFEMGEMWYDEPASLKEAFDVIASVSLNAAAQIYGGFTIPQIDELLSKYAAKSYKLYMAEYTEAGVDEKTADRLAETNIGRDMEFGFYCLEEKFNSIISPRGDYPFITISFGLGRDEYSQMASRAALEVRRKGHGRKDFKKPVLFPKLVFLFDKDLHSKGKEMYHLFRTAIRCSGKVMYPEYLSLTGESGIVSEVYKKYKKAISPMCCRAFLTKWFERGGAEPADENDEPVFTGRFNFGVVSLNLPMILQQSREEKRDFFETLDYYLELSRQIHKSTYRFLSKKKAYTNPLAFMEGGLYGGHLKRDDTIEPLLESATASYGFTALNELQRLFNGRSLVEDGAFALEVLRYINKKVEEFSGEDHIQYSVYGTPAESLCGRQVKKFREKYGVIKNVSDRDFFSNSFHCHVSEDISPIEKQDYEARFWDLANGGKIQYIRFTTSHNTEALEDIVLHAMDLGLYEGINISLAYCNHCGYEWSNNGTDRPSVCPKCQSAEMTMIERMCGYIAFTKVHGQTRLNDAKMAEIKERICM